MNPKRSFLTISIFCLLTLFAFQAIADKRTAEPPPPVAKPKATTETTLSAPGKVQPSTRTPQKTTPLGYCCKKGQASSSTKSDCQKTRGIYFATKREAETKCTGFCCDEGTVSKITEANCSRQRGVFYGNVKEAEKRCAQDRGFCCKDGEISKSTAKICKKQRGTFYRSEREATKSCQGYCCADFAVSQTTKEKCKGVRGKYYPDRQQADRFCESQKGFCCIEGQTSKLTKRNCQKKRGEFYSSKKIAVKECKQEQGFCNHKGKTFRLTQEQCDKKKGNYFTNQILANKALIKLRKQELTEKRSVKTPSPVNQKAVGVASPLALQKKPTNIPLPPGPDPDRDTRDSSHLGLVVQETARVPSSGGEAQGRALSPISVELKPVNQGQKDGVMYNLTRSISVISPAQGDFLAQGDQVDIIWNVEGDLETDCMTISLQQDTGPSIINAQYHDTKQGTSTHYQQGYTWNIPTTPNLQGPAYRVRVETCDGTVAGESGSFLFPGMNPEYSVSNIHISPPSPYVGDTINIRADIVNMGGLNSTGYRSFTLDYNVYEGAHGNLQTTDSGLLQAPPLGFGGRYQFTMPYTLTQEGLHRVYFHVLPYPGGQTMDPYLGNNYGWFEFTVGPEQLPDLVVCMKKRNRVNPPGSFTFPARVENIGNTISTPAKISFFVTGNGTRHYNVPALLPGQISVPQRTLYWSSSGRNHFEVHIDYNEQVEELSDDNNELVGVIVRGKYGDQSEIICSDHPDAKVAVP